MTVTKGIDLDALSARIVPVRVTLPYGDAVELPLYTMTMAEWDKLGEAVPEPVPPFSHHNARGEEIRNIYDPAYQQARRKAEVERAYRRLTYALVKGGNHIEGALFEDQVRRVQEHLDLSIASALMQWQRMLMVEAQARSVALAERFQRADAVGTAGHEAERGDMERMEDAAG